jgi:hypothetical protein
LLVHEVLVAESEFDAICYFTFPAAGAAGRTTSLKNDKSDPDEVKRKLDEERKEPAVKRSGTRLVELNGLKERLSGRVMTSVHDFPVGKKNHNGKKQYKKYGGSARLAWRRPVRTVCNQVLEIRHQKVAAEFRDQRFNGVGA